MIGILVTGHGRFATGITSALELVLGKQEWFEAVDFPDGITVYYGTNVAMLLDTTLNRNFGKSLEELNADIVEKGRSQVGRFEAGGVEEDDDSF